MNVPPACQVISLHREIANYKVWYIEYKHFHTDFPTLRKKMCRENMGACKYN